MSATTAALLSGDPRSVEDSASHIQNNNIYSSLYFLYKGKISEKMHIADLVVSEIPEFLIKGAYFKFRYSKNVERFLLTQEEIRGLSDYLNDVFFLFASQNKD